MQLYLFRPFCYLFSFVLIAFGQPDRPTILSILTYLFGYSTLFWLLMTVEGKKSRFWIGTFFSLLTGLIQMGWLATTFYHGNGILVLYLFTTILFALQFGLFSALFLKRKGLLGALSIASIWTVIEWSRLYYLYFSGFPFHPTGLILTFHPVPLQIASIVGMYGLTFWVIFVAALGAMALKERSLKKGYMWGFLALVPFFFGYMHLKYHELHYQKAGTLSAVLVQTGLAIEEKWEWSPLEENYIPPLDQWKRILALLEAKEKRVLDLILLPEVALPGDAYEATFLYETVMRELFPTYSKEEMPPLLEPLAKKEEEGALFVSHAWIASMIANHFRAELIVGFLDHQEGNHFNAAFHFLPFRMERQRYDKRVLVPLTEYLPFEGLRGFVETFGITTFFERGKESTLFEGSIPIAPSICFEEGYGHMIREGRKRGAEMLVNISNDAWFPRSRLAKAHFHLGRVRAIENGAPVLRACNTGVTAAIDSLGRVIVKAPEMGEGQTYFPCACDVLMSRYHYKALFTKWGDALIVSIAAFILFLDRAFGMYKMRSKIKILYE